MNKYNIVDGTYYRVNTPIGVIMALEMARKIHRRIVVDYGNPKTGASWEEHYNILGYVGRSTGDIHIPLLVYNLRSLGGDAIPDDHIVAIYYAGGGKQKLYSHPNYSTTKKH